jgi:hypothetical protein
LPIPASFLSSKFDDFWTAGAYLGDSEFSLVSVPTDVPIAPIFGERSMPEVLMHEKIVEILDLEGSVPMGGGTAPEKGGLAQVEVDATDILPHINSSWGNKAMPRPGDASAGKALAPRQLRGPCFRSLKGATLGTVVSAPGSSNIVDFGANELGLPGNPIAPPLSASRR